MNRSSRILLVLTVLCGILAVPAKSDYTYQPGDADLADLSGSYVFLWKIDMGGLAPDETLTGASLFIDNINNTHYYSSNRLYIHLLDDDLIDQAIDADVVYPLSGTDDVYIGSDPWSSSDTLSGYGVYLTTYRDLNGYASQDLTYSFTQDQLSALGGYLADGAFGLGFDPDCHFTNSGVSLTLRTQTCPPPAVPAPGALLLGSLGIGLVGWLRRRAAF